MMFADTSSSKLVVYTLFFVRISRGVGKSFERGGNYPTKVIKDCGCNYEYMTL